MSSGEKLPNPIDDDPIFSPGQLQAWPPIEAQNQTDDQEQNPELLDERAEIYK
jgi:hypothetical protein